MEKTKRLLLVVTQAEWGGVQTFVFRCAQEAQRRGYDVLVAAGGEGLLQTRCQETSIAYHRLQKMTRSISPIHDIAGTRELITLMRSWKPDTVFLHSSKAGVVGSIAAKIANVPRIVYRIGGWSFLDPVSPFQKTLRLWSEKLTGNLKHAIITVHPGDETCAKIHGIRAKEILTTVPNGLEIAQFDANVQPRETARQTLANIFTPPLPADTKLLVSIAHFYPTKDLTGYLHALALAIKEIPSIRAILFGDGELRTTLEALRKELKLEHVVALPGAQPNAATLLPGADLFVLSSAKEGMPWTVLEAMAAKTPIVATDVGSNRWALEDTAWIIPPKNPQALAHAIVDALRNPSTATVRALRARAMLESRFTAQTMWEQIFRLLG